MAQIEGIMTGVGYLQNIQTVIEQGKEFLAKVTVSDKKTIKIPVHTNLAAAFGTLNKGSVQKMDEKLKVMIAGTMRGLGELKEVTWDNVISCMMQNSLLEPMEGSTITRADKLIKEGTNVFKVDGSADEGIVKEVKSWFVKLISDSDVLADTKIDIGFLGRIVASTGATVDSFETFFAKKEFHERTLIDVGVLRYPDIEHPFFKVYRIRLVAWSDSTRILFVQHDTNGITGDFHSMKFRPREAVIKELRKEVLEKAVSEAESLFD